MPNGLGSLAHAVRSPVTAVRSSRSAGTGLIAGVGVVAGALLLSFFALRSTSSSPAPQQAQAPQPAPDEQATPSQCWITTDRERGFGFYRPC